MATIGAQHERDAELVRATLRRVITDRGLPGSGLTDEDARAALAALARVVGAMRKEPAQ